MQLVTPRLNSRHSHPVLHTMAIASIPSQKLLVERVLDWSLVKERISRYPAIRAAFPYETLKNHSNSGPYFCHYMAWRLGTWLDEQLVARLDALLHHAQQLPHWACERSLLWDGDFSAFWSLIWQLQVAEYLSTQGQDVSWSKSGGPDLSVVIERKRLSVECYVYRKSFGVELFVEELMTLIAPDVRVRRDRHLKFSMPQDADQLTGALSALLSPLLDDLHMAECRQRAIERHPVIIGQSTDHRLHLYIEGSSYDSYDPNVLPKDSGHPGPSLGVALRDSISSKKDSNKLSDSKNRPNLLLVNLLLSSDAQCSQSFRASLGMPLPETSATDSIDAVAFSTHGIDAPLARESLILAVLGPVDHPSYTLCGSL